MGFGYPRHDDPSDADESVLDKQLQVTNQSNSWHRIDTNAPLAEVTDRLVTQIVGSPIAQAQNG